MSTAQSSTADKLTTLRAASSAWMPEISPRDSIAYVVASSVSSVRDEEVESPEWASISEDNIRANIRAAAAVRGDQEEAEAAQSLF